MGCAPPPHSQQHTSGDTRCRARADNTARACSTGFVSRTATTRAKAGGTESSSGAPRPETDTSRCSTKLAALRARHGPTSLRRQGGPDWSTSATPWRLRVCGQLPRGGGHVDSCMSGRGMWPAPEGRAMCAAHKGSSMWTAPERRGMRQFTERGVHGDSSWREGHVGSLRGEQHVDSHSAAGKRDGAAACCCLPGTAWLAALKP